MAMRNPLRRPRKKIFLGGEGLRLLWKLFPRAAFFEVYVPKKEGDASMELPLIVESTETRLVEPYAKMFYRLFTAREEPIRRLLFISVNCDPPIARRVAANLAITLASEDRVTCFVDLDVRGSDLHDLFHVPREPGIVEFLIRGADPGDIIRETGIPELKFVPVGRELEDPEDVLSLLGWSETLDRLVPSEAIGLIYAGSGKCFDLSELMTEVDGTLLLFSSGEKIDRWIKKELKKVRKRSEVVGVIWTNPMDYPFREYHPVMPGEDARRFEVPSGEDKVPVVGGVEPHYLREERSGVDKIGESDRFEAVSDRGPGTREETMETEAESGGSRGEDRPGREEGANEPLETKGGGSEPWRHENGLRKESSGYSEDDDEPPKDFDRALFIDSENETKRRPHWWLLILIVLSVLVIWFLLQWRGVVDRSAGPETTIREEPLRPTPDETVPEPGTQTAPIAPVAGQPETDVGAAVGQLITDVSDLPFSIVLGSYREPESAERALDALSRAGFAGYRVPVLLPGKGRWTRLMVGQFQDETQARTRLDEILRMSEFEQGRVIETSFAYLMGMYRSREDADEEFGKLSQRGLEPYILRLADRDEIFIIYLGAFENEDQAVLFGDELREMALDGELVKRSGMRL
jgi:cell division septation protein DedD